MSNMGSSPQSVCKIEAPNSLGNSIGTVTKTTSVTDVSIMASSVMPPGISKITNSNSLLRNGNVPLASIQVKNEDHEENKNYAYINTTGGLKLSCTDSIIADHVISTSEDTYSPFLQEAKSDVSLHRKSMSVSPPPRLQSPNKLQLVPQPIVPISQPFTSTMSHMKQLYSDPSFNNGTIPSHLLDGEESEDVKPPILEMEPPMLEIEAPILKMEPESDSVSVKSDPDALSDYSVGSNTVRVAAQFKSEQDGMPVYPMSSSTLDSCSTFIQTTSYNAYSGQVKQTSGRKRQKSGTEGGGNSSEKSIIIYSPTEKGVSKKIVKVKDVGVSKNHGKGKKKNKGKDCNIKKGRLLDRTMSLMKPLEALWQNSPFDFDAEMRFNSAFSQHHPHCCICALFVPFKLTPDEGHYESRSPRGYERPSGMPDRSLPMIPEMCFATSTDNPNPFGFNTILDDDGLSPLLVCEDCKVCVHASCYGVEHVPESNWRCSRCVKQRLEAECVLCTLRGGALKPTRDGRWAHVVCALAIKEVKFEDVQKREPINTSNITYARIRLKCQYCDLDKNEKAVKRTCVQCSNGRCTLSFHVTCAHAAGVVFETSDWPHPVYITCSRHMHLTKVKRKPRQLTPLEVGDTVIAKHKNTRYYFSEILDCRDQIFYEVDFDDGSFSQDLYPEDINGHTSDSGPPPVGSKVEVIWTDGSLWGATFKGTNSQIVYKVGFEDGSERSIPRDELWLENEELPKSVRIRMSHASESKYDNDEKSPVLENDVKGHSIRKKQKISYSALLNNFDST